jgi:hypothetical protein
MLAARVEGGISFFAGRSPKLNKHMVRASFSVRTYDSSKMKSLGFEFSSLNESVLFASAWYKDMIEKVEVDG